MHERPLRRTDLHSRVTAPRQTPAGGPAGPARLLSVPAAGRRRRL